MELSGYPFVIHSNARHALGAPMFDAAFPAETTLAAETASGESQQPAGEFPTSNQQRCEALCNEITTLAGHLNAANYRFLKLLDEFDRHEGWAGDGIRSLAHWLNFKCGFGHLVAARKSGSPERSASCP